MKVLHILPALATCIAVAHGHFQLNYPAVRGYDNDTLSNFPCGGQNSVSSKRTQWPLNGGSIQLNMEHQLTNVQVLLALGNDPGSRFNYVLDQTFTIEGIGKFCLGNVTLPRSLRVTNGVNATIQVVSNSEDGGGLYNCADITFKKDAVSGNQCTNGTGVRALAYNDPKANANTTINASSGGSASASKNSGTRSALNVWSTVFGATVAITFVGF